MINISNIKHGWCDLNFYDHIYNVSDVPVDALYMLAKSAILAKGNVFTFDILFSLEPAYVKISFTRTGSELLICVSESESSDSGPWKCVGNHSDSVIGYIMSVKNSLINIKGIPGFIDNWPNGFPDNEFNRL